MNDPLLEEQQRYYRARAGLLPTVAVTPNYFIYASAVKLA